MPDSAASLSVLNNQLCKTLNLEPIRTEEVYTAGGIVKLNVVSTNIKINDLIIKSEFVDGQIPELMPFDLLLGRNIIDLFDVYLLGKMKILCIKDS